MEKEENSNKWEIFNDNGGASTVDISIFYAVC
jgi:hypothetical protein